MKPHLVCALLVASFGCGGAGFELQAPAAFVTTRDIVESPSGRCQSVPPPPGKP